MLKSLAFVSEDSFPTLALQEQGEKDNVFLPTSDKAFQPSVPVFFYLYFSFTHLILSSDVSTFISTSSYFLFFNLQMSAFLPVHGLFLLYISSPYNYNFSLVTTFTVMFSEPLSIQWSYMQFRLSYETKLVSLMLSSFRVCLQNQSVVILDIHSFSVGLHNSYCLHEH